MKIDITTISILIFGWLAVVKGNPWLVWIALPFSLTWALGYALNIVTKKKIFYTLSGFFLTMTLAATIVLY